MLFLLREEEGDDATGMVLKIASALALPLQGEVSAFLLIGDGAFVDAGRGV